jgi:ribosome assembly protein YihI (activator of Der GTPase)
MHKAVREDKRQKVRQKLKSTAEHTKRTSMHGKEKDDSSFQNLSMSKPVPFVSGIVTSSTHKSVRAMQPIEPNIWKKPKTMRFGILRKNERLSVRGISRIERGISLGVETIAKSFLKKYV